MYCLPVKKKKAKENPSTKQVPASVPSLLLLLRKCFSFEGVKVHICSERETCLLLYQNKQDKSHQQRQWCRDEPDNSRGAQRLLHSA